MKLHLDFSELTNLAKLMMPEGINFSLNTYTSMFLLNDIELAFDKDINFIEFDNHDEHKVLIGQYLSDIASIREGANKRGNSSRLTQSFHFFSLSRSFLP